MVPPVLLFKTGKVEIFTLPPLFSGASMAKIPENEVISEVREKADGILEESFTDSFKKILNFLILSNFI